MRKTDFSHYYYRRIEKTLYNLLSVYHISNEQKSMYKRNAGVIYWLGAKYAVIFNVLWRILINLVEVWKWESIIPATRKSFLNGQPRIVSAR